MTFSSMDVIDEIKVRAVVALCDDLCALDPSDSQYPVVLERLVRVWQALSAVEQDEADRILGQPRSPTRPRSERP